MRPSSGLPSLSSPPPLRRLSPRKATEVTAGLCWDSKAGPPSPGYWMRSGMGSRRCRRRLVRGRRSCLGAGEQLLQSVAHRLAQRGKIADVQIGEEPHADLPVVAEQRHPDALLRGKRDLRIAPAHLPSEEIEGELRPGD